MHVCVIFLYFGVIVVGEGYFCNVLLISYCLQSQQPPCSNQYGKSRMIGLLSKKHYYAMFLFIIHFCYILSFVCKIYNGCPFQQKKANFLVIITIYSSRIENDYTNLIKIQSFTCSPLLTCRHASECQ